MNQSTLNMLKNMNNSFHSKYINLCKARNFLPNHEVTKNKFKLEIVADRMKINEWQMIIKALDQDNSLQSIEIVSRKAVQCVREQIDSEKSCRALTAKGDPLIATKFIFFPLIRSISNCIKQSTEITSLALEGLPLTTVYIQSISNAILQNSTLKMLSFARSNIMDDGCIIICSTIKHLSHIEKLNFSHCDLTDLSAIHISDLIKFQTINRYSQGWMKSFRYEDVGDTFIPGLKCLVLNGNTQIGDKGLQKIVSNLKDDEWIKAIEVQNCGITDAGGRAIKDCLNYNKTVAVFDINQNPKIGKQIFNDIQRMLGADPDVHEVDHKERTAKLKEKIDLLEQRLEIESINREHAHELNIQLHNKLKNVEAIKRKEEVKIPSGFTLVNEDVLNALYKQLEDLRKEKNNQSNERHQSIGELKNRISDQSGFGDADSLQIIRNNQRMSRFIQDYAETTVEETESSNMSGVNDQSTHGVEASLYEASKNKMKSVHTIYNEPAVNTTSEISRNND